MRFFASLQVSFVVGYPVSAANSLDGISVAQGLRVFGPVVGVHPLNFFNNGEIPSGYRRCVLRFCQVVRGSGRCCRRRRWPASTAPSSCLSAGPLGSDRWRDLSEGVNLKFHVDLR